MSHDDIARGQVRPRRKNARKADWKAKIGADGKIVVTHRPAYGIDARYKRNELRPCEVTIRNVTTKAVYADCCNCGSSRGILYDTVTIQGLTSEIRPDPYVQRMRRRHTGRGRRR